MMYDRLYKTLRTCSSQK